MLIFEANVILYSKYVSGPSIMSGVRCSLNIDGNDHICQIETVDGEDIPLDTGTCVKITTISGEISLLSLVNNAEFILLRGKEIGKGYITRVKEVYLEKKYLEIITDKSLLKKIIDYAENMPNAIVYEDVYELLK
ncbi:MAG: hypothetical protein WCD89_10100 [Anaerocolumna sp.]